MTPHNSRVWSFGVLVVAVFGVLGALGIAGDDAPSRAPLVAAVGPITITVADLDRSVEFYTGTLSFELEGVELRSDDGWSRLLGVENARTRTATLRLGNERLRLLDFVAPEGRPIPPDSRSHDAWFQHIAIAVSDMDRAVARLSEHGVRPVSAGPQTLPAWNSAAGGISAFYFRDPDDHVLEVIHFPPGKGDPRWREPSPGAVFLGIDHTAIVTADTDRAAAFYQNVLGLQVAGGSENFGVEQERLNSVFGARLRITTLRAASGPGIELLEYLTPRSGRDFPRDTQTCDLWHWHVTLTPAPGVSLPDCERALRRARASAVSAAPESPDRPLEGVIARDPDGHAVLLAPELLKAR